MDKKLKMATVTAAIAIVVVLACTMMSDIGNEHRSAITALVDGFDSYGDLTLTVTEEELQSIGVTYGDDIRLESETDSFLAMYIISNKGVPSYSAFISFDGDKACLGFFNLDARNCTDLNEGDVVTLSREGRNPNYDKIPNYLKGYTDDPEDYDSPIVFSNFREVRGGDLIPDYMYRSASPWNAGNRSPLADDYLKEYGVEFMICLNLNEDEVAKQVEKNPDAYASDLFKEGKVLSHRLHSAIHLYPHDCEFVIESLLKAEGKIGIFCTQGKDRTGLHCAVLEGLAGATYDEILDDFMESICNYYHIEKGSEEYDIVSKMYPERVFYLFAHPELIPHPEKIDWNNVVFEEFNPEEVFTKYLVDYVGMDADKVQKAKGKLTGRI